MKYICKFCRVEWEACKTKTNTPGFVKHKSFCCVECQSKYEKFEIVLLNDGTIKSILSEIKSVMEGSKPVIPCEIENPNRTEEEIYINFCVNLLRQQKQNLLSLYKSNYLKEKK